MHDYLEFEKPIREIEEKIEKLATAPAGKSQDEIRKLRIKLAQVEHTLYSKLTPWQRTQLARHPQRPSTLDYIGYLFRDFLELHGDRSFGDDRAIVGGFATYNDRSIMVIGHQKGKTLKERMQRNFGMPNPEGYRKALRLMKMAEKFGRPIVTFIDTPGAYPGIGAEERGQGEAIARSTERCLTLGVPMVAVISGEGGSGGAIAIAAANTVLMLEHAYYSVISPEGAASILYRKKEGETPRADRVREVAIALKITAQELLELRVIDAIVPEPVGGAHREAPAAIATLGAAVAAALDRLAALSPQELRAQRRQRFMAIGRVEAEAAGA